MQRTLYILLWYLEMIAQLRVGAIFSLSVIVPMQWLSVKTHILAHPKWGENHMASAIYCVYNKFQKIRKRPALIIKHTFMMNIVSKLYRNMPELEEYLNWYQGEKNNQVHACKIK